MRNGGGRRETTQINGIDTVAKEGDGFLPLWKMSLAFVDFGKGGGGTRIDTPKTDGLRGGVKVATLP